MQNHSTTTTIIDTIIELSIDYWLIRIYKSFSSFFFVIFFCNTSFLFIHQIFFSSETNNQCINKNQLNNKNKSWFSFFKKNKNWIFLYSYVPVKVKLKKILCVRIIECNEIINNWYGSSCEKKTFKKIIRHECTIAIYVQES